MNWMEFNNRYEAKLNVNNKWVKQNQENYTAPEFYKLFENTVYDAYDNFVRTHKQVLESNTSNFIVDFTHCIIYPKRSGRASIWVESKNPTPFLSKTGIDKIILVEAIRFEIKWRFNDDHIVFEIYGHLHPERWEGRNQLNYNGTGKTVFTGFDRIVNEKVPIGDFKVLNRIKMGFSGYFQKVMSFYFLQS